MSVLGPRPWLVLGGGGLKGLAHVGAWRALHEVGFRPEGIIGTSIGAIVGAALAGGATWRELAPRALEMDRRRVARFNRRVVWVNGIREESVFQGEPLRALIRDLLPLPDWNALHLPLQVNAVDLGQGALHWFGPGARLDLTLADAVYASCALPVLFPPQAVGGTRLVDGGMLDALPLSRAAELGATGILAIDVGSGGEVDASETVRDGLISIHQRVFSVMAGERRREGIRNWQGIPLRLVRPDLNGYGAFDFEHRDYFLSEGHRATQEALDRWA